MDAHLPQVAGSVDPVACTIGLWCAAVGFVKWLNMAVIPEYILLGSAVVLTWQLYRMFRSWRDGNSSNDDKSA